MENQPFNPRGRGAAQNPPNRFEKLWSVRNPEWTEEEDPSPQTEFLRDASRSVITYNDSPDVGFQAGLNPYRGCEHGCIYCYARPTHEYLGFSAGLDFESKILVKENAPELLREELSSRRWKPQVIVLSGVTDCYQPVERRLRLTRRCLEALAECRNPVVIITKNRLVTRDIDLLQELTKFNAAAVMISVTTLRGELAGTLEPRASRPSARIEAIRALAEAGIAVGVNVAPIIPGLNDYEMPAILKACAQAGARFAGYTLLRLPHGVGPLFEEWLGRHRPDAKQKILNRIREMRGGRLNDPRFQSRMRGEGPYAQHIAHLFDLARRKAGIPPHGADLSCADFRRPGDSQLSLPF